MVNFTCPIIYDKPIDPKPFFENGNINFKAHDVGWLICGVMTLIATVCSIWLIWKHLTYYTCPQQQRHIVRLLIMVPVYAIVSFMSYLFYHDALYYQTIRDCYEAVLVTSFFYLILAYTGDTTAEQHAIFRNLNFDRWVFPLGSLRYKPEGLHFLWIMKIAVLQYAIVRPLCTFVAVGLEYFGYYCLHSWMPWFGHVWCAILISISVTVAMFCLIQLYVPIRRHVDPYKPILKFLAVKTIVFLTFWQDTLLSFLVSFDVIKDTEYFTADQIQAGINALLQCFWMMLFGFVHIKAFSYLPYRPADEKCTTIRGRAMLDSLDFRDWFWEMKESTRYIAARSKGKQYTLAEDLRANRHQHLLKALGVQRAQNLEHEISLEKEAMPTFWRSQPEPKYSSYTSKCSADAYTTPPPRRSQLRLGVERDASDRDHVRHSAELDKLVAQLDIESSFYDAEEDRSLLHNHSSWLTDSVPTFNKRDLASSSPTPNKVLGSSQYHSHPQLELTNIPSLEYNDSGRNDTPGSAPYEAPRWLPWTNPQPGYNQVEQPATAEQSVYQRQNLSPNAYQNRGDSQLQRGESAAGRWLRTQWDRISNAESTQDKDEVLKKEEDRTLHMTPPRVGLVSERPSDGPSMPQFSQPRWSLHDTVDVEHTRNVSQIQSEGSGSPIGSRSSLHVNLPVSRSIQTSQHSVNSEIPPNSQQQLTLPELPPSVRSQTILAEQPEMVSRHPSVAPFLSMDHPAGQQQQPHQAGVPGSGRPYTCPDAVRSPSKTSHDTVTEMLPPTQAALPPAVGPKGKVFSLVLPTPLSPARYPYGQENVSTPPVAAASAMSEVVSTDPAASSSISATSAAAQDSAAAPTTTSNLTFSLPAKAHKHESTVSKQRTASQTGVIMPGAFSLSQVKAQEALEASQAEAAAENEASLRTQAQAQANLEAEVKEAQRAEVERKRMLVEEQRRTSIMQQRQRLQQQAEADAQAQALALQQQQQRQAKQQQQQRNTFSGPVHTNTSPAKRNGETGSRIVLPAPSQLAYIESEDRYRRYDQPSNPILTSRQIESSDARPYQSKNSALSVLSLSTPSTSASTAFEVGTIVPRQAVLQASGAPPNGYYRQIYHQHQRQPQQGQLQQRSLPQADPRQQQHQYARYHQDRQSQLQQQTAHYTSPPRQHQLPTPLSSQPRSFAPNNYVQPAIARYEARTQHQPPPPYLQNPHAAYTQHPYQQQ